MNVDGFRKFGKERNYSEETIEDAVKIISDFNDFLSEEERDIDSANKDDVHLYAEYLVDTGRNKKTIFYALIRYCYFSGNNEMIIALYELLDGSDVLENLAKELIEVVGEEKSKQILNGIEFPVLGTLSVEKPIITK
ncbi:MAG TPA: site-specific integrase [Candidatus Bathyarchaeia archaeon]|nr:site-specific integrase [Candidatus Bathyarchaeia archaeon]